MEEAKLNGFQEQQSKPQKLRRRDDDDDTRAAKSGGSGVVAMPASAGPGRKSKACEYQNPGCLQYEKEYSNRKIEADKMGRRLGMQEAQDEMRGFS